MHPDHFIFLIHSPVLDYEIFANFQKPDENTTEMLLNTFMRHDQSNRAKERDSVLVGPFQVDIIGLEKKHGRVKKKKPQKHPGAGQKRRRIPPIEYHLNEAGLFLIENDDDQYCLFRALEMLKAREVLTKQRFYDYRQDKAMQYSSVIDLMRECNIDQNLDEYAIEDYGPVIEAYYNRQYPLPQFKIFAFENFGKFKPFYKGPAEQFSTPLCLYYWRDENHYDAIKSIRLLYKHNRDYSFCFTVIFFLFIIIFN